MADLAKVKFQLGDKLWVMLDKAGFKPTEIPAQLERIARANGTTSKVLENLTPDSQLWVPEDIAKELPPDRLLTFQEGRARASDASARRAGVIRRHANEALRKVFKDCTLHEEVIGGGFKFTLTSDELTIVVGVQTPRRQNAWIDPGLVTMTNEASGLSATVELAARDPAKSIRECKTKLDAVHEYARTLEGIEPAMPVFIVAADPAAAPPATEEPASNAAPAPPPPPAATPAPPPEEVAPPVVVAPPVEAPPIVPPPVEPPPVVAPKIVPPPIAPPPVVVRRKKPATPPSPALQMAAIVGLTLVAGLGLGWVLFH